MARIRSPERSRSKAVALEEISRAIEQFQELLAQVEDFGREGFPYGDAARNRTELRLRDCVRRAFGDKSPEFQAHRNYKLLVGNVQETKQSLSSIKTLIATLEDKKLELQGLKPTPPPEAPAPAPMPAPAPTRPPQIMKLVPPTTPTAQVTITPAAPVVPPPVTVSVALTTNLDMAGSSQATSPPVQSSPTPPALTKASAPQPARPSPPAPAMKQAVEVQQAEPPQPPASDPSPKEAPVIHKAPESPPAKMSDSHVTQATAKTEVPSAPATQPAQSIQSTSKPTPVSFLSGQDTQEFVKHLCNRFHAVTRQLRLRKEYRATLDVEDELDVQDLIHAMLRFQFDDVEMDEWIPDYAEGTPRKTFLIDHGRLAIVAKKTRPGLTTKDLANQVKTDAARYSVRNRCAILLCFIYDPEGRIGNPRGLEADLTSVSDQFTVDVLVTPK